MSQFPSDGFAWLESCFSSRCDGRWEHDRGVRIESTDNPGWWVHIDGDASADVPRTDVVLEVVGEPPSVTNG